MSHLDRIYTTDATVKRVSETSYRIACGRRGCSEMLGYAVRGDELLEELGIEPDSMDMWYAESGEDIGYDGRYISEHHDPIARVRKEWYLWDETRRYRKDDRGDYYIVEMKREHPRRSLPEELASSVPANRIARAEYHLRGIRGVIGQRPLLPVYLHCPACAKRFAETRNRIPVP
jgi:hypothetical protein